MKFLVPNYNCLQNPWPGGYRPQIPVLSVLCPQLNGWTPLPHPRTKFLSTPLEYRHFPFSDVGYALNLLAAGQHIEKDIYLASCRIDIKAITRTA